MASMISYSKTIKLHPPITTPNSGNQAARLVTLSQTTSGKILVHAGATVGVYVLGGGASVDANSAPTPDNRSIVKAGFARVVDIGSVGYVSIKARTAADETIYIEEVE